MRVSTTLLAVAAFVASQAAAVPSPEPEAHRHHRGGWLNFCGAPGSPCLKARDDGEPQGDDVGYCGAPGNPCSTVKRAAHAIADALAEARAVESNETFCGVPGQPCEAAKNEIDKIADQAADAYATVYEREADAEAAADPEARRGGWLNFCGAPGSPCLKARDAEIKKREAEAEAEARRGGWIGFCGVPGAPCLKARDASPEAEADPEARRGGWMGFCGVPGAPCLKARDASPEAEAKVPKPRVGYAHLNHHKHKHHKHKHHKKPIEHGGKPWYNWCGAPGSPCLKARDAAAVGKIIQNNDPTFLKKECFKEGNECHTLLKVQQAFEKIKTEAQAAEKVLDPIAKLEHCDKKDAKCGILTHAHQYATKHNKGEAEKKERECNGPDGACTVAKRDLEELEESINAAVGAFQDEE